MGKDYEDYFKNSVENPSLNTTENEESKELFTGSMDDIDTWVKFHKLLIEKENQESERALRKENAKKAFWFSAIPISCVFSFSINFSFCERSFR